MKSELSESIVSWQPAAIQWEIWDLKPLEKEVHNGPVDVGEDINIWYK